MTIQDLSNEKLIELYSSIIKNKRIKKSKNYTNKKCYWGSCRVFGNSALL